MKWNSGIMKNSFVNKMRANAVMLAIFVFLPQYSYSFSWEGIDQPYNHLVEDLAVQNNGRLWALAEGNLYYRDGKDYNWNSVNGIGTLVQIEVTWEGRIYSVAQGEYILRPGRIYGLDEYDQLWVSNDGEEWEQIPGKELKQFAVYGGGTGGTTSYVQDRIVGVDRAGKVWFKEWNGSSWEEIGRFTFEQVELSNSVLYGMDSNGDIWTRKIYSDRWSRIATNATDMSATGNSLWFIKKGALKRYDVTDGSKTKMVDNSNFKKISAAHDGRLWGILENDQLVTSYGYNPNLQVCMGVKGLVGTGGDSSNYSQDIHFYLNYVVNNFSVKGTITIDELDISETHCFDINDQIPEGLSSDELRLDIYLMLDMEDVPDNRAVLIANLTVPTLGVTTSSLRSGFYSKFSTPNKDYVYDEHMWCDPTPMDDSDSGNHRVYNYIFLKNKYVNWDWSDLHLSLWGDHSDAHAIRLADYNIKYIRCSDYKGYKIKTYEFNRPLTCFFCNGVNRIILR